MKRQPQPLGGSLASLEHAIALGHSDWWLNKIRGYVILDFVAISEMLLDGTDELALEWYWADTILPLFDNNKRKWHTIAEKLVTEGKLTHENTVGYRLVRD